MKKIFSLLTMIFLAVLFTACGNDWLDVKPANAAPTEEAIISYTDLLTARTGMYDGIQGTATYREYYAARMIYFGDVRGDDMQARAQGMRSSSSYEMNYTADNAPNIWNVPYNVIRRANGIIKALDNNQVQDATEAQIGKVYAEALVTRALVHFDLVKVYGNTYTMDGGASLGIPIMLEPMGADALPTRNTVAQVYDQVIKDLNEAINSGYMATAQTQGYLNIWSAKALLSRVYLFKGDNENALAIAEDVINSPDLPYKLWTRDEYAGAWLKTDPAHTNEILFEILNPNSSDWTDREGIAYLYHENGYADAIVTTAFSDLLAEDPDDIRNEIVLPAMYTPDLMTTYGEQRIFVNKYPADPAYGEDMTEMRFSNVPLLRLSEVYLNAAEAAFKTGSADKAAQYLNVIIQRANPNATGVTAGTVTLEKILNERRKELVGEGQRFFDAMRNDETITRYTDVEDRGRHYPLIPASQQFDRTYFRVILPIPVSETDVNPNIRSQQNPGY